ncbi:MAG: hypothetical protein ACE5G2_10880 [Candidatus Krumholzibacteriia bacterium]
MWKTSEGSTGRLLELCSGYFLFYVITGVAVKYFLGKADLGLPAMHAIQYLTYSTVGGASVALLVVLVRRWYHLQSVHPVQWGRWRFPSEFFYIVPSGVCTAVVIPTTTLMYTLPISVMVAMVIMRGAIIVVSRIVDSVQIRQGLLKKKVYVQENVAVVFALLAVGTKIVWTPSLVNPLVDYLQGIGISAAGSLRLEASARDSFVFLRSPAAMGILSSYITAYAIRIYIMNYYKNTRGKGQKLDNKAFFAIEQIAAFTTMVLVSVFLVLVPHRVGWTSSQLQVFRDSVVNPHSLWGWAILSGTAFGIVAFFSVFIFMFKGRTATFAGLVNRLTSLIAGTTATLVFHFAFGGRFPSVADWLALLFILIAVGFLTQAERRRRIELAEQHEIEAPWDRRQGVQSAASTA